MRRPNAFLRVIFAACALGLLLTPVLSIGARAGEALDWAAVADVRTIHALTVDEDGSPRETKIWLAVLDGHGYIRTLHSTHWGSNIVRHLDFRIRISADEFSVRATFIEEDALRARIIAAFRQKYGTTDWFLQVFRGGRPYLMRLDSRP